MLLHVEQVVLEYLEKYGYLFESDSSILLEELNQKTIEKKIRNKYNIKQKELDEKKDSILQKLKNFGEKVKDKLTGEVLDKVEDEIELKLKKLSSWYYARKALLDQQRLKELGKLNSQGKAGLIISGIGLASVISYSAYKLYKEERSKSIQICLNKKGKQRIECIGMYTRKSLLKRLYFLKRSVQKCKYSKDPVRCKDKLDEEILKVEAKIKKYGEDLANGIMKRID